MPSSLFAADNTKLYCSAKSKLMDILENISSAETSDVAPTDIPQPNKCVAIIHTTADIQSMVKPSWIKTYKDLSARFIAIIQKKSMNYIFCLTGMVFQNHLCQQQGIWAPVKYFTDRSKAVLLLWIFYVFSVLCLLCLCARLFICTLWSPAGKGLTSWLSFVVSYCEFVTFSLVSWVRLGT